MWDALLRVIYTTFAYIAGFFSGKKRENGKSLEETLAAVRRRDKSFSDSDALSDDERVRRDKASGILRPSASDDV